MKEGGVCASPLSLRWVHFSCTSVRFGYTETMSPLAKTEDVDYPEGVDLYDPEDFNTQRSRIYEDVKSSLQEVYPIAHGGVRLELAGLEYDGPDRVTKAEQRKILLRNGTLTRRLRGTLRLIDEGSGDVLDEQKTTLMRVPVLTDRGTFIHNGNEIGVRRQARLLPGPYTRRQNNGHLETQFNARVGTGKAFRVGFEPDTGQYRFRVAGSNIHMYSLLHDLGVSDEQLAQAWGHDVLKLNSQKYDTRAVDRAYAKLIPSYRQDPKAPKEQKAAEVKQALDEVQVASRIARRNLPNLFDRAKAASWHRHAEGKDLLNAMLSGSEHRKEAAFSSRELDLIIDFLNETQQANLQAEGAKAEKELAILTYVTGGTPDNTIVRRAGEDGLRKTRQSYDFLPDVGGF